jgi:Family of unknown function (DUF6272)
VNYSDYREFCELVSKRDIVFYYFGYFSQNIISAMADTIRLGLKQTEAAATTKRKLFSCFVEMAQNIIHYSTDTLTPPTQVNHEMRHGSVCIGHEQDRYYLMCANRVARGDVEGLRSKLDPLRTMTLEEIKRAYHATLRTDLPEGSKGSGLGFLTVARDASEPLEFEFGPCDDPETMMFYLKATI